MSVTRKLRALLPGQLSVTLCVWLIGSILLAKVAWLVPAYLDKSRELWRQAETETRILARAAVDPQAPNSLVTEKAIFQRLQTMSSVVGMRVETATGEMLTMAGNAPALTGVEARARNIAARRSQDGRFLDLYLPRGETQLPHEISLRVDMAPYFARFGAWLKEVRTSILTVVLLLTAIGYATLYFVLIRPVMKVHRAISGALQSVQRGRIQEIAVERTDELGAIARHTNEILYELARSSSTTTAIATRAIDDSRVVTLVYDDAGKPIYANKAAFRLFDVKELEALTDARTKFLTVYRAGSASEHSVEELLDRPNMIFEAMVPLADGPRKFLCAGHVDRIDADLVRQRSLHLIEIDALIGRIDRANRDRDQEQERRMEAERQAVTAKLTLESCMLLMGAPGDIQPKTGGLVDLPEVITAWARMRGGAGMGRPIRYNNLPKIAGDREQLTSLFNQALSFIDYRSIFSQSEIRVLASTRDGMVFFDITERAGENRDLNTRAASGGAQEWTLCFAALNRLVGALGGYVDANPQRPGPANVSFGIPKIIGRKAPEKDQEEGRDAA